MERKSKTKAAILTGFKAAVWVVMEWPSTLPVLWGAAVKAVVALILGIAPVWLAFKPVLPETFGGWLALGGLVLLAGLGVQHLIDFSARVWPQATASLSFRNLSLAEKRHLATMRGREPDPTRMKKNGAMYQDLSGEGLIREVRQLASNQAMVRLTRAGGLLVDEWQSGEAEQQRRRSRPFVQNMRTVWNGFGETPVSLMANLFHEVLLAIEGRFYWANSLQHAQQQLDDLRRRFKESLMLGHIEDVTDVFNDMYEAYMTACWRVAQIDHHGDMPTEVGGRLYSSRIGSWAAAHRKLDDELRKLADDPNHSQALRIYWRESPWVAFERPELKSLLNDVAAGKIKPPEPST